MAVPRTTAPPPAPAGSAFDPRTRRRGRWRWAVIGLLALVATAHVPILRGLAGTLIVDDPTESADQVLVLRVDYCFDRAAELYHGGTISRILVIDRPPTRLVRLGLIPPLKDQYLRELGRRGIGPDRIALLPGSDKTPWQIAHALQAWLVEHPRARVLVFCDRFTSGDLRFVVSRVMDAGEAERVAYRGLPDHRYDETNWWRSRAGVRAFTTAAFDLAYDHFHGEDPHPPAEIDFDQFERALLRPNHVERGGP